MTENFSFLFQYLKKENINIDQNEFIFQVKSHPDYPSLLAFSDTLHFFNILNGAMTIAISDLALLPDRFVSLLKEDGSKSQLYCLEKKGEEYFCYKDKHWEFISSSSLEARWDNVVLLVEKEGYIREVSSSNHIILKVIFFLCFGLFVAIIFQMEKSLYINLFFMFPLIGFLFSIAALKDFFGTKNEILTDFCNITSSTSCSSIVSSDKWKIFKFINFSDLSILLFSSQFFGLLLFLFSGNSDDFFSIQKILLLGSIPVILLSLYYQKFIEEIWCPICLVIIGLILLELGYVIFIYNTIFNISAQSLNEFGLVSTFLILVWFLLKNVITEQNKLKELQFEGIRFMRNYEIFKKVLISGKKIELADSPIVLGNKESNIEIAMITSPFCGHCEKVHDILEKIVEGNKEKLKIKILINADIDTLDDEKKTFFRVLMSIYIVKGEAEFVEALHYWFNNKNLKNWIDMFNFDFKNEGIDSIYQLQNQWCIENGTFATPAIFLNGYKYPRSYKREDLQFLVKDFIEDNF